MLNSLTPKLHMFVKRNPTLTNVSRKIWYSTNALIQFSAKLLNKGKWIAAPEQVGMTTKEWIENAASPYADSARFIPIEDKFVLERTLPQTSESILDPVYENGRVVEMYPLFVAEIPNGRVFGQVTIITPDNLVLEDVSRTFEDYIDEAGNTHFGLELEKMLPPVKKYRGTVAVLTDFCAMGYGHWMMEVLPRWELIRQAGYDMDSIDYFLVNGTMTSFQQETLEKIGIPKEKLIQSIWNPHIQADKLIVPANIGDIRNPHPFSFHFLRDFFGVERKKGQPKTRIYINRNKTSHRRIVKEPELEAFLSRYGFISVSPEDYNLEEKAELFSQAEVVIGPTGAGFTHLVFCDPGTQVIEFLNVGVGDIYYWVASQVLDFDYYYMASEFTPIESILEGEDKKISSHDISINLKKLESLLEIAGIKVANPVH